MTTAYIIFGVVIILAFIFAYSNYWSRPRKLKTIAQKYHLTYSEENGNTILSGTTNSHAVRITDMYKDIFTATIEGKILQRSSVFEIDGKIDEAPSKKFSGTGWTTIGTIEHWLRNIK